MLIFMVVPQAYTNLSIFKRIEVWILLVLTVAGLVFVLLSRDTEDPFDDSPTPDQAENTPAKPSAPTADRSFQSAGPAEIRNVTLRREGENYIAEIALDFDNQTTSPVRAIDSARLVTGSGKSLPVFFLAFTGTPPVFPPETKSAGTLRFSLLGEDIVGGLTLDIAGQRSEIKSARSFDPESIAKNESKSFNKLDW